MDSYGKSRSKATGKYRTDGKRAPLKLYVYNLEWSVHEAMLKWTVSTTLNVRVKSVKIVRNASTKHSLGFGYISFYSREDAQRMLNAEIGSLLCAMRLVKCDVYRDKRRKHKLAHLPALASHINLRFSQGNIYQFALFKYAYHAMSEYTRDLLGQLSVAYERSVSIQNNTRPLFTTPLPIDVYRSIEQNKDAANLAQTHGEANVLPLDVLVKVFAELSLRDLCNAERVCKQWRQAAKLVWASKVNLAINHQNVKYYVEKTLKKRLRETSILEQILCRKSLSFSMLTRLDLSEYASVCGCSNISLAPIAANCTQLTELSVRDLSGVSNLDMTRVAKRCKRLRVLDAAGCGRLTDSSIGKLFRYCRHIEQLDLSRCYLVTAACLNKLAESSRLTSLVVDTYRVNEASLTRAFTASARLPHVTHLSMRSRLSDSVASRTLLAILCMAGERLVTLELTHVQFANEHEPSVQLLYERLEAARLPVLTTLNVSSSETCTRRFVAAILKNATSLRRLDVAECDELFRPATVASHFFHNVEVNAPIEQLTLDQNRQLTDETMQTFARRLPRLHTLQLNRCDKLTCQGVCRAMIESNKLARLEVKFVSHVDNSLLDAALSLADQRPIEIIAYDTAINTGLFVATYGNETRLLQCDNPERLRTSRIGDTAYRYELKNLTFEGSRKKKSAAAIARQQRYQATRRQVGV